MIGIHGYVGTGANGLTLVTQLGFTCANGEHELGTFGPPTGTYFDIKCNPGDAASGVGGRAGTYVDSIGLTCRDPRGNEYVAPVTTGPFFGEAGVAGGNAFKSTSCGNTPLIGLAIWSGSNIDGVEPVCNPAQPPEHFGGYGGQNHGPQRCTDHVIGIHGYVGAGGQGKTVVTQLGFSCANGEHELGTFGPPNGSYFDIKCNPGDAAYGVGGRAGTYVDAIGLWCRDPRGNEYVAPVTTGPFFAVAGVGGGYPYKSMSCGNTPLIGLGISSGVNIDGVVPLCTVPLAPPVSPPPPPKIDFSASPNNGYINVGDTAKLTWVVTNCTPKCSITMTGKDGFNFQDQLFINSNLSSNGVLSVSPTRSNETKYILTATGKNGSTSKEAIVQLYGASKPCGTVFMFKMTNDQSFARPCFVLAFCAADKETAKQIAESQNPGYSATPTTDPQACPVP
ncbi:hypothetical protein HFK83_26175 [Ralstonia pseudosolanacearum]|uniref:Jacalin-type lectin domain-containing protein n=1 Tax=Ralstonia syzygii TaxID=28097 RepID=A0ABX7ZID1_9RALS|nr:MULTISPECIES: hypothetical protein [Ralstonia solanacearum species complex]MCK4125813.1 hypothetical protein [Ralstonia pseudosolanacearum]QUP54579.1 hypothetical protein GO998_12940 [Ralstonia syzygii]